MSVASKPRFSCMVRRNRRCRRDSSRSTSSALILALYVCACQSELTLKQGDEFFGVATRAVLDIRMESKTQRAEAHRFGTEQRLMFSFERASGSQFERCASTPQLEATLKPWESVRIVRVVEETESKKVLKQHQRDEWIHVEVHDIIEDDEPFTVKMLRIPGRPAQVYASVQGERSLLVLDAALLSLMTRSCKAS